MEMSWQWVAGFFDGEGCVSVVGCSRSIVPRVCFAQSGNDGKKVLTEISVLLKEHGIVSGIYQKPETRYANKTMYTLNIDGRRDSLKILLLMLPYARVKKAIIQDGIRIMKIYPDMRKYSGMVRREMKAARSAIV